MKSKTGLNNKKLIFVNNLKKTAKNFFSRLKINQARTYFAPT